MFWQLCLGSFECLQVTREQRGRVLSCRLHVSPKGRTAASAYFNTAQSFYSFNKLRRDFGAVFSWFHKHFELPSSLGGHCELHSDAGDRSRNEPLVCEMLLSSQMATPVGSTNSGKGREVETKSRSRGHSLQWTTHGKWCNNPGVKAASWTLSTVWAVENYTKTAAHPHGSV